MYWSDALYFEEDHLANAPNWHTRSGESLTRVRSINLILYLRTVFLPNFPSIRLGVQTRLQFFFIHNHFLYFYSSPSFHRPPLTLLFIVQKLRMFLFWSQTLSKPSSCSFMLYKQKLWLLGIDLNLYLVYAWNWPFPFTTVCAVSATIPFSFFFRKHSFRVFPKQSNPSFRIFGLARICIPSFSSVIFHSESTSNSVDLHLAYWKSYNISQHVTLLTLEEYVRYLNNQPRCPI